MIKLRNILPPPDLPQNLDEKAKWLAGEGAGSWFIIEEIGFSLLYKVTRYSPQGNLECEGIFSSDRKLILSREYEITYPSHCQKVSIIQNEEFARLQNVDV